MSISQCAKHSTDHYCVKKVTMESNSRSEPGIHKGINNSEEVEIAGSTRTSNHAQRLQENARAI